MKIEAKVRLSLPHEVLCRALLPDSISMPSGVRLFCGKKDVYIEAIGLEAVFRIRGVMEDILRCIRPSLEVLQKI